MSELRLEYVSVSELVPYDKNPRKNDDAAEKLVPLIEEFGFKIPILVDIKNNRNEIISGHTRIKAALLLGLEKVPVIFSDDLSPEQVKAFRMADNKSGEWAEWNFNFLTEEIQDLKGVGYELTLTGFNEIELETLVSCEDNFSFNSSAEYGEGVYDSTNPLPKDHVDVQGLVENNGFVCQVTFETKERAIEFLKYVGYKDLNFPRNTKIVYGEQLDF